MTTVLIAADTTEASLEAARVAHTLFGDTAEYLVVNVGQPENDNREWGASYPLIMPLALPGDDPEALQRAEAVAADVAESADLPSAEPIGDTGDPATAIIRAAHQHDVDVIVVGSHKHSWFSRLFSGSVTSDVVRDADIPVLVVK